MTNTSWGLVGIGKLGKAVVNHVQQSDGPIGIYHPDQKKRTNFCKSFKHTKPLQTHDLNKLDYLIVALPAANISDFVDEMSAANIRFANTVLINMATTCSTIELKKKHPKIKWLGMKYMGHSESLRQTGQGLFVTEDPIEQDSIFHDVFTFFSALGQVIIAQESIVETVNKLATYQAIKACKELEKTFQEEGLPTEYLQQVLLSVSPEVIKSYVNGTAGHFAQQIADEFDKNHHNK